MGGEGRRPATAAGAVRATIRLGAGDDRRSGEGGPPAMAAGVVRATMRLGAGRKDWRLRLARVTRKGERVLMMAMVALEIRVC